MKKKVTFKLKVNTNTKKYLHRTCEVYKKTTKQILNSFIKNDTLTQMNKKFSPTTPEWLKKSALSQAEKLYNSYLKKEKDYTDSIVYKYEAADYKFEPKQKCLYIPVLIENKWNIFPYKIFKKRTENFYYEKLGRIQLFNNNDEWFATIEYYPKVIKENKKTKNIPHFVIPLIIIVFLLIILVIFKLLSN